MKQNENKKEGRRLTLIDLFVIIGALLLIVAVVGQDVAVYMINRNDRSERFGIVFAIPAIDKTSAAELMNARVNAGQMQVLYDGTQIGTVDGGFVESAGEGTYTVLTGNLLAYGKTVDNDCRIYGFNRVFRPGDRLYVIFEDAEGGYSLGCTVVITDIERPDPV